MADLRYSDRMVFEGELENDCRDVPVFVVECFDSPLEQDQSFVGIVCCLSIHGRFVLVLVGVVPTLVQECRLCLIKMHSFGESVGRRFRWKCSDEGSVHLIVSKETRKFQRGKGGNCSEGIVGG